MKRNKKIKIPRSWDDFNLLPMEEELDTSLILPPPQPEIISQVTSVAGTREPAVAIRHIAGLMRFMTLHLGPGGFSSIQVESVFRFTCQVARYRGMFLEEYTKRDEILSLFFHCFYDLVSFSENSPGRDFREIDVIIDAVVDREGTIQKFSIHRYDYSSHNVFLAKLFRDSRLKGYLLGALRFYQHVPTEELLLDRETDIENIVDALGVPGWDEFLPVLAGFLNAGDEAIKYTAVGAIGRIGGAGAIAVLQSFRRDVWEGMVKLDEYGIQCLELNIILARDGPGGIVDFLERCDASIESVRMAVRLLAGIQSPRVIRFLYSLLDDHRFEDDTLEIETYRDSPEDPRHLFLPLKEEAMMALESYEEDYIISILGDVYIYRRENFYNQLDKLYQNYGIQNFWEDEPPE